MKLNPQPGLDVKTPKQRVKFTQEDLRAPRNLGLQCSAGQQLDLKAELVKSCPYGLTEIQCLQWNGKLLGRAFSRQSL